MGFYGMKVPCPEPEGPICLLHLGGAFVALGVLASDSWMFVVCLLDFGVFCIERLMLNIKLLGCFMGFPGKEGCHLSLQNRLQARSLSTNCSIFPSTWAPAH